MPSLPAILHRHFLAWDRPWIARVTEWLAREWTGAGALDLSGTLAIVPTRQAGRRLREALAELAAKRGAAVFAARVLTPEALLQQDRAANAATPLQSLLAWVEILRRIDLADFPDVFPVAPPARSFSWALRLGQQFARLQVVLAEAGWRPGEVAKAAGDGFVERARWEQIGRLERLHAARLAELNLCEPNSARLDAAGRPRFERQFKRIVVLGTPDLPALAVRRLASAAAATPVEIVIFAPEAEGASFDPWGRPVAEAWERRVIALPDFEKRVHLCADPASQATRVAALVSLYSTAGDALAVGIADPEVAPLLENELHRLGRPVFNPEGRLVRHEGLHALLSALAELMREPAFGAVEALARCPDIIRWLQSIDRTFSAAHWLKSLDELRSWHLPADLDAARRFAQEWDGPAELGRGLEAIAGLRETMRKPAFAEGVAEALRQIFRQRKLDRTGGHDARLAEAATAWTGWLRECQEAGRLFAGVSVTDWWEIALRLHGDQRMSEEKRAGALELQGWIELLWEDAPHLVVAGMNEGLVPEAVPEDPFLPGRLRQRLGLTTNATRFARDAYLLQALAACRSRGGRIDLLHGKVASSGEPLHPSRLLLRSGDAELPERIRLLFRAPEVPEAGSSWTRAWRLAPRQAPPPEKVAVTALRRYLACPFRFYLSDVLKMQPVDPLKSELDALDFGILVHGALERIGSDPELRGCEDARVLRAALLRHLDRAVAERFGKLLTLPLIVQIESARQRLGRLAELQAVERAAGWEIVAVEHSFEIEISGLRIRGKIDRIDRHAHTGAVRVLDYKTSDRPASPAQAHLRNVRPGGTAPAWSIFDLHGRTQAWIDLQLPLYLRALASEYPGRLACGYFNLPKASGDTALLLWDDYPPELHESALRCAAEACAAIRRGEFWPPNEDFDPNRDTCAALFHRGVESSVEWRRVEQEIPAS